MKSLLLVLQTNPTLAIIIFPFLFVLCSLLWLIKVAHRDTTSTKRVAPEATGALPLIGHLHLFRRSQLLHKTLGSMADKYGPIFTIKLGFNRALVVSDLDLAKECFTTNDKVFASRPRSLAVDLMAYNGAMFAFSPYGRYWRQIRKLVTAVLFSKSGLDMIGHVRVSDSEIRTSIRETYELCGERVSVMVEMKRWFADLTINVMVRMVVGKRYSRDDEEGEKIERAITEFHKFLGAFVVSDAIPFLRCLDLGGYEKGMKETAREIDGIVEGWLEEHKRKRDCGMVKSDEQDFMDVLLSLLDSAEPDEFPGFDSDTIGKATCLTMLTGGTDSSTVTLTWALSLLLNHPRFLRSVQAELDLHVGRDRFVNESDLNNLVYLQAVFKETLRLYPPGPLSIPHLSIEDCVISGYNIPKNTQLLVNLWKIHRDPRVWSDPNEFRPERFLTGHKNVDVKGQNFELIPFGSGRRICPGISFALQNVQLTLASLIHGFEIGTVLDEPVDMTESSGITNNKATPLEVVLTPRLPANLYI